MKCDPPRRRTAVESLAAGLGLATGNAGPGWLGNLVVVDAVAWGTGRITVVGFVVVVIELVAVHIEPEATRGQALPVDSGGNDNAAGAGARHLGHVHVAAVVR